MVSNKIFRTKITVEISKLFVNKDYFAFNYTIITNGKKKSNSYNATHSWGYEYSKFRRLLREGEAARIAIQTEF